MDALSQDHRNDCVNNAGSIVALALATQVPQLWFFDPVFAIMFACWIAYNWGSTARGAVCFHLGSWPPWQGVVRVGQ